MSLNLKHTEACCLPNVTDSLVAQVPRPQDMTIFVLMTMTTITMTTRPITLRLAHARGVIIWYGQKCCERLETPVVYRGGVLKHPLRLRDMQ